MTETSCPLPSPAPRALRRCAGPLLVAVLVAGCGSAAAPVGAPRTPTHTALPAQQQAAPADPVALRSTMERLLGAHVLLADEFVRTAVSGDAEQNAAVGESVARNQAELVELVTAQGGAAAGQEFQAAWQNHVDVLGDVRARRCSRRTPPRRRRPVSSTSRAEAQLARSFSTVVGGTVPLPALTAAATMHGEHLLDQADAFASGGYDTRLLDPARGVRPHDRGRGRAHPRRRGRARACRPPSSTRPGARCRRRCRACSPSTWA